MRTARTVGGLVLTFLWAGTTPAEPTPQTITVPEVLVRSGPSVQFYPTGLLRRGDVVNVVKAEATGWLAIMPPQGSFSWINQRLVDQGSNNFAVVIAPEAPVRVGSRLIRQQPTVERVKVVRGTIVVVTGLPLRGSDGVWLPIQPVPSEFRYIPAEAVRPTPAPPQFANLPPEPPQSLPRQEPSSAAPTGNPNVAAGSPVHTVSTVDQLVQQAEETERVGNLRQAETLWGQLAEQVKNSDYTLWLRCRSHQIALQQRLAAPAVPASVNAATAANQSVPSLAAAPPAASAGLAPVGRPGAASQYSYVQDGGYTARLAAPVLNPAPPAARPAEQWTEPVRLRRTGIIIDGRPAYRLEPVTGKDRMWMYVTAGNGVNLEPYVERVVMVYGTLVYMGELRTNYMAVLQVNPVPSRR